MRLLLMSNSMKEGCGYLEFVRPYMGDFLGRRIGRVLFLPYAAVTRSPDDYVAAVAPTFAALGCEVDGLHGHADPVEAVERAEAIVVGGGNTWALLRRVHELRLTAPIVARVSAGVPYVGWSAGANLACPTIKTTNDMPIVDPLGLEALGLVPFQINPHYFDTHPPGFKGETREQRLLEFVELNPRVWVAGLRENTLFRVEGGDIRLLGDDLTCRLFRRGEPAREVGQHADLRFLLARPA